MDLIWSVWNSASLKLIIMIGSDIFILCSASTLETVEESQAFCLKTVNAKFTGT